MFGSNPPWKTPDELADGVRAREEELQRSARRARRKRDDYGTEFGSANVDQARTGSRVRLILRRILGRQDGGVA
jgi:hypothetical protein